MIVASLMLVIAAAVTLLVGLLNREVIEWVYASIACCLLAGLLLTIGVLRSRPSRKPVLQSGGEGQGASWAGASQWGSSGETGGDAGVLTRDEDETDGTVRVTTAAPPLVGDDEPTRTAMPAPAPPPATEGDASPWAPQPNEANEADDAAQADRADTGDLGGVRVVDAAPSSPAAPAPPPVADDEVVVVPKPSSRGATSAVVAGAGQPAVAGAGTPAPAAASGTDDAARFEQVLSPIAGVGAGKRAALFQHFGTYRKLRAASPEKLAEVPGISRTLADRIYQALHSK